MHKIRNSDIIFILNPNSGKRQVSNIIKSIKRTDENLFYVITKDVAEVKDVFDKHIEHFTVFVIVGGDGSVNEAVKYLVNRPDKYLSVYPNGSGNGFAKELGFKGDLDSLLRDIRSGDAMDLDVIKINDSYSINASGVGLDSYVAHAFSQTKNRGLINYILLSIKSLFAFKPFKAAITSDDFKVAGIYQMITIANTRQFGNNAFIAPLARPDDGIIDIVLVKPIPFYLYPYFVVLLFLGQLNKSRHIDFIKTGKPITIESEYNHFHVDGEPVKYDGNVNVSIKQDCIKVIKTASL